MNNNLRLIYSYWRIRIFYSIFFGYIFFNFSKRSLVLLSPFMITELHFSLNEIGLMSSIFYIIYGISKFFNGIISDKFNSRYVMSLGLSLTGFFNIFIGFSYDVDFILFFWGLNAVFQGCGWSSITKQLTHWYNNQERGFLWGVCSTSNNIGSALVPLVFGYFSVEFGWRFCIKVIGFICVFAGLILFNRLRNTPESVGLPSIEIFNENKHSYNFYIIKSNKLFYDKFILFLCISYFFIYIIRTSFNDWSILYFINQRGYSFFSAELVISYFEIGGIFGMIISGYITDILFNGKRIFFIFICLFFLLIFSIILYNIPTGYKKFDYFLVFLIGFFVFSPQMLVGLLASEVVSKDQACTANGFVGCWAYLGAAVAGYPFSLIINISWNIFFSVLVICSCFLLFLILPFLFKKI